MNILTNYKVYLNYFLCRLGFRDTLPRDIIQNVEVKETNEPLVDISDDTELFFINELLKPIFLRQEAYIRLKQASKFLPKGYCFKIHDAYRDLEEQKASWNRRIAETRQQQPNLDEKEVERITRLKIANPFSDGYGGHQTGGAIDITLCDNQGHDLNLGTKIPEHTNKTKTKSKFLTEEEKKNRNILITAMTKAGFKNYPVEWWHFCFGDKMWAAYSWKGKCFYGYIEKPNSQQ